MGNRRSAPPYLVLLGSAICIAIGLGWFLAKRSSEMPSPLPAKVETVERVSSKQAVHLYFGDSHGRYLTAEQRVVDQPLDAMAAGRQLLTALIQGPRREGSPTLPKDARLRAFYMTGEGTAYVDFMADAFDNHPGGVGTELLSIYSIVNTLVLNVEAIRSVKFLLGGQEAATLVGHVDLRHPFEANMLWVR